jgi:D-hexose-6-phosphate mutarotase
MLGATLAPIHAHAHARNRNWDLEQEHDYDDEYEMAHFALVATIASVRYMSRLLPRSSAFNLTLNWEVLLDFSVHHDSARLFFRHFEPEPFVEA